MTARWNAVAILIGAYAFSGAAIAQDPAPNSTIGAKPTFAAPPLPPASAQSAAPDDGPMVAPVKRMKPVTPDTKAKDRNFKATKTDAVTPVASQPTGAKAMPSDAGHR